MYPELSVRDTSSANQVIRIMQVGAASVSIVTTLKPLSIGVMDEESFVVVTDENNNVTERGEIAVNYAWVSGC
jgi:hypothetical protein